ncbi:hypothetical protein JCM17960_13300 [Magnetospira thiophila]
MGSMQSTTPSLSDDMKAPNLDASAHPPTPAFDPPIPAPQPSRLDSGIDLFAPASRRATIDPPEIKDFVSPPKAVSRQTDTLDASQSANDRWAEQRLRQMEKAKTTKTTLPPVGNEDDYKHDFAQHPVTPQPEADRIIACKDPLDWSCTDNGKVMTSPGYFQDGHPKNKVVRPPVDQWHRNTFKGEIDLSGGQSATATADNHPDSRREVDKIINSGAGARPAATAVTETAPPSKPVPPQPAPEVYDDSHPPTFIDGVRAQTGHDVKPAVHRPGVGPAPKVQAVGAQSSSGPLDLPGEPWNRVQQRGDADTQQTEQRHQMLEQSRQAYRDAAPDIAARERAKAEAPYDWEGNLKSTLTEAGVPEPVADLGVVMISVTPVGTALDLGQGAANATRAFARGDMEQGLSQLAQMGLDTVRIGKVRKVLEAGGDKAVKALAKAMPDINAAWMAKELAQQGLAGPVVKEAIARGLKNNLNPAEALTYGVFSAHAKNSLNIATEAVLGKGKTLAKTVLREGQQSRLRELMADNLSQSGAAYLTDVRKEVQERMVQKVMDELFGKGQSEEKK